MEMQQARNILAAHDARDTALRNLRNAAAMAADDSRSTEMLEAAGDQYATATRGLCTAYAEAIEHAEKLGATEEESDERAENPPMPPVFEIGQAARIADGQGSGAGFIADEQDGIAEGHVALRLTTEGTFNGGEFAEGAIISVPIDCLTSADA